MGCCVPLSPRLDGRRLHAVGHRVLVYIRHRVSTGRHLDDATQALAHDRAQHPSTVAERAQGALPIHAVALEAWHLADVKPRACDPDVYERLHLKAGAVNVHRAEAMSPECVVAVTQV